MQAMQSSAHIPIPGGRVKHCFMEEDASVDAGSLLQAPCSPQLADRTHHPFGRRATSAHHQHQLLAHAASEQQLATTAPGCLPVLAGQKRACEASSCAADGSEEDDDSMTTASQSMRRSGSARSLSIKRVCSVASADALSPCATSLPMQHQQSLAGVRSSTNLLHLAANGSSHAAAAAAAAAKRGSKPSSSSMSHSSLDGGGSCITRAGSMPSRGPRVRLGGRLLSPEEAQRHLAAAAAAAAAAMAGKALSRAQSPAMSLLDSGSPAGPTRAAGATAALLPGPDCSASGSGMSMSAGGPPPAFNMGRAGSISSALPCKLHASSGALPPPPPAMTGAAAAACLARLAGEDCLPEAFIPTPEQAGTWQTLASTLDEDMGCGSSPHGCSSYTGLLLGGSAATAGARAAPPAGVPAFVSAFAPTSSSAWPAAAAVPLPVAQQQHLGGGMRHAAAAFGSSAPASIGGLSAQLGSDNSSSARLDRLSGSFVGSNSLADAPTLAHSLAAAAAATAPPLRGCVQFGAAAAPAGPSSSSVAGCASSAVDAELALLLDNWAPQQQQPALLAPVAVHGSSGSLHSLAAAAPAAGGAQWRPAFTSAFAPPPTQGPGMAGASAQHTPAIAAGMMPTPGLPLAKPQHQQQLPRTDANTPAAPADQAAAAAPALPASGTKLRIKTSVSRARRQHKLSGGNPAPAGAGQVMQLSQEQLLAVMQESMAASYASGYMAAMQQPPGQEQQQPRPGAGAGAAAAGTTPGQGGCGAPAAAAAVAAAAAAAAAHSGQLVDDILPSLQELLTDCY